MPCADPQSALGSPQGAINPPRLAIGLADTERLTVDRLGPEAAAVACLGGPSALMRKLVEHLGKLLARHHLGAGVLRELLERGDDLLADRATSCDIVGEVMQRCGDLLLLLSGDLLRLTELLAETLLAREAAHEGQVGAVALTELALTELMTLSELMALSESELAQAWVAQAGIAELRADSLGSSVAAHHSGCPERRGHKRLSEVRGVVSVRHEILHLLSSE